jgi:hypothetical protein
MPQHACRERVSCSRSAAKPTGGSRAQRAQCYGSRARAHQLGFITAKHSQREASHSGFAVRSHRSTRHARSTAQQLDSPGRGAAKCRAVASRGSRNTGNAGNTATRATRATLDIGRGKPATAAGVRSARASAPSARTITAAAKGARRRASVARPTKGTTTREQCSRPGSCLRCRGHAQAEVIAAHGSGVTVRAAARVNAQPAGRERQRRVALQGQTTRAALPGSLLSPRLWKPPNQSTDSNRSSVLSLVARARPGARGRERRAAPRGCLWAQARPPGRTALV